MLIWITGLSGSGKTTIGKEVYSLLKKNHSNTIFLDGDTLREVFGNDLSFTHQARLENAKRIHRMCEFLVSQDIRVVCATMSLYKEIHILNRMKIKNYFEVFIDCSIDELIKRDQKGLYSEALKGNRKDVVGISMEYDKPISCELIIDNTIPNRVKEKASMILSLVDEKDKA